MELKKALNENQHLKAKLAQEEEVTLTWLVALQEEDVKSLNFTFCIKQSNVLQLENDDFVAKDDSLTFLTHLATEHVENIFRSGEEQVSKLELLRSFADRIHKRLPHEEANLHPGMKSHLNRPKIQ